MTLGTKIVATLSATAVAGSAAAWLAVGPRSEATGSPAAHDGASAAASRAPEDVVVVCVAEDRVVRAPLAEDRCAPGQVAVSLLPDEIACALCQPFEEPAQPDRSDSAALNDVERRIRALEQAPYFEVVNDAEQPIFRVGPDGVRVFNTSGVAVAAFGTSQYGGYFVASSGSALVQASLGAIGTMAGVQITEDGLTRMSVSAAEGGGSAFRLPSAAGTIAGIGASIDGPGALLVGTLDGEIRSSLTVPGGRGMVRVLKNATGGGLSMLEPTSGGGMLEVDNVQGEAAIRMGHLSHRYGIVMAGPRYSMPLVPKSGLPGSYFLGCGGQAPPACMPPE